MLHWFISAMKSAMSSIYNILFLNNAFGSSLCICIHKGGMTINRLELELRGDYSNISSMTRFNRTAALREEVISYDVHNKVIRVRAA